MFRLRLLRFGIVALAALAVATILGRPPGESPQRFVVVLAADILPAPSEWGSALEQAEAAVAHKLFAPSAVVVGRPWYRFGIDTLTIIETGPGPKVFEAQAAAKGHWAAIDFDYARLITRPYIKIRQARFASLFRPSSRPHQLDVDLALAASRSSWMTGASTFQLIALRQKSSEPATIPSVVKRWLDTESGKYAVVDVRSVSFPGSAATQFAVETAEIRPISPGHSRLSSAGLAPFDFGSALKVLFRWFSYGLVFAFLTAGSRWVWTERFRARHFELWIPGFATAFCLPLLQGEASAEYRARLPRYAGEPAAHLELPGRLVRELFYSHAVLRWDSRLSVDGLPTGVTGCRLRRLPRFVRFVWVERPEDAGTLHISLERRGMLGGNDRMAVSVRFLSLTRTEPNE